MCVLVCIVFRRNAQYLSLSLSLTLLVSLFPYSQLDRVLKCTVIQLELAISI